MKIGFTSTSFRQIRNTARITDIAVSAGAEMIEWGGDIHVKNEKDAAAVKRECDSAGIDISSYASYYRVGCMNGAEWRRICEIASVMDCSWVRVWLGTADSEKTDAGTYRRIAEDTVNICGTAKEYGLKVCPECHDSTFNNSTDAFLKLYNDVNCDNLRTYFQSRYKKKEYDLDRIERTLPQIECVHISYSEQTREQFPFFDKNYINDLLSKLISSGYDGNILLEYTYLFGYYGIPSMMIKDMGRLREKVRELK